MRTRAAALLTAAVVAGASLGACGTEDDPSVEDATDTPSASPPSEPPSQSASQSASQAPSPGESGSTAPATVAAPAYFVGDTPLGKRLYREFRDVEADNPADEALALVGAGDALDPDYSTLLPGGSPTLTSYDEGAQVALPDASWATRPAGMSARDAELAVQQIVYTVQGVVQKRLPVGFTVDGSPTPVFGLTEPEGGFTAGKFLDVLALCNVTAPAEGASVSGTFTASGVASSFEGTVPWEVRDQTGTAVVEGFAQAEGWVDDVYPWESPVDVSALAPGTYTFVAMTDDPSGGEGGGPTQDTKTITVG